MEKKINFLLIVVACLLAAGMVVAAVKTIRYEFSEEVVMEKRLRGIFEEHQMELPKEYEIVAYDHTPADFQGKCKTYYEIRILDEDFPEVLDTQRTEQIDAGFAAMADGCDYHEENTQWCFEGGTVINREMFYSASHIKYNRTSRFRTLYMWYAQDTGNLYILHSDG